MISGSNYYIIVLEVVNVLNLEVTPYSESICSQKLDNIKHQVISNPAVVELLKDPIMIEDEKADVIMFFSISNAKEKAKIFVQTGNNIETVWDSLVNILRNYSLINDIDLKWIKVDIVCKIDKLDSAELRDRIRSKNTNFYRKGISFDPKFKVALLEAELNSNKIINYKADELNIERLSKYLRKYREIELVNIPDLIYEFSTISFFVDENYNFYELYTDDLNFGRRKIGTPSKNDIYKIIERSSAYLANNIDQEGKFTYGYFPTFDKIIENYNILRHSGALWSLLISYKITNDPKLLESIRNGIRYLIQDGLVFKDHKTAYILERKANEIKLGGNAIAIILLISYMEDQKSDEYMNLVLCLGNGILELLSMDSGKYYHVLEYPGFVRKAEQRTIYYDGEATLALCKLFGITKDQKWLLAAKTSLDYFIDNNYIKYVDHWVSYSVNEFTKHSPEDKYLEFGLKNVYENIEWIFSRPTTYHIYSELLMQGYEIFNRARRNEHDIPTQLEFDYEKLITAIKYRLSYSLNAFFYPEYAMYFKNPERIVDSFFIRQSSFRVRIDDIQHFLGGLCQYYFHYEDVNSKGLQ